MVRQRKAQTPRKAAVGPCHPLSTISEHMYPRSSAEGRGCYAVAVILYSYTRSAGARYFNIFFYYGESDTVSTAMSHVRVRVRASIEPLSQHGVSREVAGRSRRARGHQMKIRGMQVST